MTGVLKEETQGHRCWEEMSRVETDRVRLQEPRNSGHHRAGLGVTTGQDSGGKEHLNIILVYPTSHRVTQHLGVKSWQIHDREGSLLAFLMASAGNNDFIPFEQWQGQDMIIFWEINKLRCAFTTFISNLIAGHTH